MQILRDTLGCSLYNGFKGWPKDKYFFLNLTKYDGFIYEQIFPLFKEHDFIQVASPSGFAVAHPASPVFLDFVNGFWF